MKTRFLKLISVPVVVIIGILFLTLVILVLMSVAYAEDYIVDIPFGA